MKLEIDTNAEWDSWADLYDLEHDEWTSHDLPFYLAESRVDPPVLELACGTGRLTIPIAQAGIPITGIDPAAEMLARAQAKAEDIADLEWVLDTMEDFSLEKRFGLIFIAYSGFLVLKDVAAQEQTLANIRGHLKPNGRFIMDMFVPNPAELGPATTDLHASAADLRLVRRLRHPQTDHIALIWEAVSHIPNEQTFQADRIIQTFDNTGNMLKETQHAYTSGRYVHRYEMLHLLRLCGFQNIELYSSFDRRPFGPDSSRMIWIASPATR